MNEIITELVKIEGPVIVTGSTRGCNTRYKMWARTACGELRRIETNPTSESNFTCSIKGRTSSIYRMVLRSRGGMPWIADAWDNSASYGVDLEAEFANLKAAIAANKEQNYGQ